MTNRQLVLRIAIDSFKVAMLVAALAFVVAIEYAMASSVIDALSGGASYHEATQ